MRLAAASYDGTHSDRRDSLNVTVLPRRCSDALTEVRHPRRLPFACAAGGLRVRREGEGNQLGREAGPVDRDHEVLVRIEYEPHCVPV
jgi:hypothetical protein